MRAGLLLVVSALQTSNVALIWVVMASTQQVRHLVLVWFSWERPAPLAVIAGMVFAQGASVCLQTARNVTDIHSIVLLEIAARQISTTLHVLEFLLEETVNSQANVPEIKLASTENVAQRY